MQDAASGGRLAGICVGISGAVPAPKERQKCGEVLIHNTLRRLVERILTAEGNIVYGSHPTFTDVIEGVAEGLFAEKPQPGRIRMYVGRRFFHPQPGTDEPDPLMTEQDYEAKHRQFAELEWVGPPKGNRQEVLDELREGFISAAHALVCIGGKGSRQGIVPGVGQEAEIALHKGKPVFLMAWAGGYTETLYRDWRSGSRPRTWNSLSDAENELLSDPGHASDSVDMVLEGLSRIRNV